MCERAMEQKVLVKRGMAIASLRYNEDYEVEETKGDIFIYDGSPANFYEWEFRTGTEWKAMMSSGKPEDRHKAMSMIVKGMRKEAARVAMDIGNDRLIEDGGYKLLVDSIRKMVFPFSRSEAKPLYRVDNKTKGTLSRQNGESMVSYIYRRRR